MTETNKPNSEEILACDSRLFYTNMERGGWSSIQTLKRIYQHTTDAKREAVNAEIERYFAELLKEEKSESGEV